MALQDYDGRLYIDGHKLEIDNGYSDNTLEVSYAEDCQLVGIRVFSESGFVYGDYATVTAHHPIDDSELSRFGNNCYLPTGNPVVEVFTQGDGAEIPSGIKIKVRLDAIDTNGRKAIIWLMLKK